jgi:ferric enterobactin receptor
MAFLFSISSLAQTKKDSILTKNIEKHFFYGPANKELEKLVEIFKVKINFNQEKLSNYSIYENFDNQNLQKILESFCKATESKYFIDDNNVVYIVGKNETYSPELNTALQKKEDEEQTSLAQKVPKKFNITVSGKVTDVSTGEPLPNVNVTLVGEKGSTTTNIEGYFTLYGVPSDTSILEFSAIGYEVYQELLSPEKSLDNLKIQMLSSKNALSEVVVTKKTQSFKLNQKISMIKLTPAAIATLPSIGEKDIFRSFQLMPGVSAANENSSGLYVRGGTPDQSLVLYDGFTVYNVEHLFGFFSTFNSNAIKDVLLFKGGFESKYGGRLSSVVDINGKEGNSKNFNFGGDVTLLSVNLFAEGPLGKKASAIISYRRSFETPLYNKIFGKYSGVSGTESGASNPNSRGNTQDTQSFFYDFNSKFTWKPTKNDVFSWSLYNGEDDLDNSIIPNIPDAIRQSGRNLSININDITNWGNTGSSLKWSRKWNAKVFTNTLVSYSKYFSNRDRSTNVNTTDAEGNATSIKRGILEDNNIIDYSVKTDAEINLNKSNTIEMGYHITLNDITYSYAQNDTVKIIDRATKGNTYTVYLQDKITAINNKLTLIPGIRHSYFDQTRKIYLEPRFNATYDINEKVKIKGSIGRYYQFAKRVIREDILQGSRDFWVLADDNNLPVSSSNQYVLGASWENKDYLIDVEAYYKTLDGLSEYSSRFQPQGGGISFTENYFIGTGYARGIDFLIQKKFGKYNGWIGYTIGEAVNNFPVYGAEDFFASNDVRHEFKTVHMYKVGKFDFSATFIYASGKPYTAPSGAYTITQLDGTTQDYFNVTNKNELRLPAYQRLDLGATFNFGKLNSSRSSLGISLFNVYNNKNVWYKNFEVSEGTIIETDINYLGFTPNLTFTYKFK